MICAAPDKIYRLRASTALLLTPSLNLLPVQKLHAALDSQVDDDKIRFVKDNFQTPYVTKLVRLCGPQQYIKKSKYTNYAKTPFIYKSKNYK